MNRQQTLFIATALLAVFLLFFFGRTVPEKQKNTLPENNTGGQHAGEAEVLDFSTMLGKSKQRLTPEQLRKVTEWEHAVVRGAVKEQQITTYKTMARFWMDTVGAFVPYIKYTAEAAKLENSEKNLTFAAHLLLTELQRTEEMPLKTWMAVEAKQLFEKALELNPSNDSTRIGLGSCYFFGAAGNEPPMTGIRLIREVTEKKPENTFAQFMLGVGSYISGQWPKAIERFNKVVALEPDNLEAILRLADAYEQSGDKQNAKKWYVRFVETVKRLEQKKQFKSSPEMIKQLEEHIKTL